MENSKHFEQIISTIAKQLGKRVENIKPEHRIIEDLGADSLDIVELLMTLEDLYGITIPDDVASNLPTVHAIVTYLDNIVAD